MDCSHSWLAKTSRSTSISLASLHNQRSCQKPVYAENICYAHTGNNAIKMYTSMHPWLTDISPTTFVVGNHHLSQQRLKQHFSVTGQNRWTKLTGSLPSGGSSARLCNWALESSITARPSAIVPRRARCACPRPCIWAFWPCTFHKYYQ